MKELDLIDHAIGRLDEILLRNRNWGTTLWAGLIAIILQAGRFEGSLLLATAVIPLLFWLIDIRWKMALLQCGSRQRRISKFLNNDLQASFDQGQLSSIDLLDPTGEALPPEERGTFLKALLYKDTIIFYPLQVLGSVALFLLG